MKKLIRSLVLAMVVALSSVAFVACDDNATELTSNMVALSYTSVSYDGTEKTPGVTVTVNEEVVDSSEYTVEYKDNIKAGNATVKVTAKEKSRVLTGSVSVGFVITKAEVSATSLADVEIMMENANVGSINMATSLTLSLNQTLTIKEGYTLNMGENQLSIQSGSTLNIKGILTSQKPMMCNGNITGDGEYISKVNSLSEIISSLKYADKIVLEENILSEDGADHLQIFANYTKNDIEIDLNQKTLFKRVSVRNTTSKDFKITIRNGNIVGKDGLENYAITMFNKGTSADKYVLILEDVVATSGESGLSTNGKEEHTNATIIAKNCTFGSKSGEYGLQNGSMAGVNLNAKYVYKFDNCKFVGKTGYYTKSGDHTLVDCTVTGLQTEYKNPINPGNFVSETGSALVADSASGYQTPLKLKINGGEFTSINGYAIEEVVTTETGVEDGYTTIEISGNPSLNSAEGKQDKIILTKEVE